MNKKSYFAGTVQGEKRLPARGFSEEKTPKFAGLQLCRHMPPFLKKKERRRRRGNKKEAISCLQSCKPARGA
jgi:hypothetical protein